MECCRIKLKTLNPYITCYICKGYLIDATTVTECLHTFCKSCLLKHLDEHNTCPKCEILIHQSHPRNYISYDRTLQDIVYKLVPDLFNKEMQRREAFYRERGLPFDNPLATTEAESSNAAPADEDFHRSDEQVSLYLYAESEELKNLTRPFVRCSVQATVTQLKKFVAKCLYSDMNRFTDIDILCNNEMMGKDHSLKFILRTRWRSNEPPLKLEFRPHVDF
ncbi:unnamed protein product [Soboliphyme baturini]|uniref:RING-type domain-containing protein n=1 Tax=Soboliphyme baturini TaxID=241478 RepID=A0A183IZU1_9BILA|nr:unnamed protein product [Soboliphyme baturini]